MRHVYRMSSCIPGSDVEEALPQLRVLLDDHSIGWVLCRLRSLKEHVPILDFQILFVLF